jgi:hypothetical protein
VCSRGVGGVEQQPVLHYPFFYKPQSKSRLAEASASCESR